MSTNDAADAANLMSPISPETEWDEDRIKTALARLQEMHIQMRQLRETIPMLMRSVHNDHGSPEDLYADISQTATKSVENIKTFTAYVAAPESQKILKKAKSIRETGADGVTSWLVTQHPNWLDNSATNGVKVPRFEEDGDTGTPGVGPSSPGSMAAIVEKFKEQHSNVEITMDQKGTKLNVFLPSPAQLSFQIDTETKPQTPPVYTVSSKDSTHLCKGILRALAKRSQPDDLLYLLDMLSAYSDVKTRACDKCKERLDRAAQFPIIRVRDTLSPKGNNTSTWKALHDHCYYGNSH